MAIVGLCAETARRLGDQWCEGRSNAGTVAAYAVPEDRMIEQLGLVAAIALPLWNIPLIVRIHRRRSSKDVSEWWALGVWLCLLAMLPAGLRSADPVFKVFTIVNLVLFTGVLVTIFRYRG